MDLPPVVSAISAAVSAVCAVVNTGRTSSTIQSGVGKGAKLTAGKKSKLQNTLPWAITISFCIFLGSTVFWVWKKDIDSFKPKPPDEIVSGRNFVNEEVKLDDAQYIHCKFDHCKIIYDGKRLPSIQYCQFDFCVWVSRNPAINEWIFMGTKTSLIDPNSVRLLDH